MENGMKMLMQPVVGDDSMQGSMQGRRWVNCSSASRLRDWFSNTWADVKLRWQLAMYGEVMILNAIDAIDSARENLNGTFFESDPTPIFQYLDAAESNLKQVINYEDEPDPTDPYEYEGDGVSHVVPKDYAVNQGNQ